MKFGQSAEEAAKEPRGGSGGDFLRYLKDGANEFRILQEPEDWIYFYEHFQSGAGSFPCTRDRDTCPGCTSDNEKTKRSSYRVAFNVLSQGQYVNAMKMPITVADKLKLRYDRIGTLTDRDYMITRYKGNGDKIEFDVEGMVPGPPAKDVPASEYKDVEELLGQAYAEMFDPAAIQAKQARKDSALVKSEKPTEKELNGPKEDMPPWAAESDKKAAEKTEAKEEPKEYSEAELRGLSMLKLLGVLNSEGINIDDCPKEDPSVNDVVDWLLTL